MARRRRRKKRVEIEPYRRSNEVSHSNVQFKVLSEDQCKRLYNSVLEVLEGTGIDVYHKEAVELMRENGCWVDDDGVRVRIPTSVAEKAIKSAPSRIVLSDRNKKRKLFIEKNNAYFGPGPTNLNFIDVYTGERRPVKKSDVYNTAKVVDALPNIDFCMSLANISDCTAELADVHEIHAMLQNTTKPIVAWAFNNDNLDTIIKMFETVAGGEEELKRNPNVMVYSEPTPPLVHTEEAIDKLLYMAEKGLPQLYTPVVQGCATAPGTKAGTIVINLCDTIAGLIIAQMKNPGTPCLCGGVITNMDMKTTTIAYGSSPEFSLMHAASTDVLKYLGIPVWGTAGCSDAKSVDEQVGIDLAFTIYTAALSGANIIHDVGYMEAGMSGSLESLCMADEVIGMSRSITRGVEVNDDTLGLDVINKVGPGGHFLAEKHTMKYFQKEFWQPKCLDRDNYKNWVKKGEKTYKQKVNERVKNIIENHEPQKLPDNIVNELDKLVEQAETRVEK